MSDSTTPAPQTSPAPRAGRRSAIRPAGGQTIFSRMTALAAETGALNLGQGHVGAEGEHAGVPEVVAAGHVGAGGVLIRLLHELGDPASADGFGIIGMRERVEAAGGRLRIMAVDAPAGLRVEGRLPIAVDDRVHRLEAAA